MKKLLVLSIMAVLVLLGMQGVAAEEIIDEVIEPTAFDNWVNVISDFASLKNFVLTSTGIGSLVALLKLRGAYKFLKSAKGLVAIEDMFIKVLGKVTDKPDLVVKIVKIVATMPVIENLLTKATAKADMYDLELQGKILDYEAKLEAQIFEGDSLVQATAYLARLRTEYETYKSNE